MINIRCFAVLCLAWASSGLLHLRVAAVEFFKFQLAVLGLVQFEKSQLFRNVVEDCRHWCSEVVELDNLALAKSQVSNA